MKLNPKLVKELLNLQYPIGKTELFFDNDDHSGYMGFTWQLEAKGKAIVGIDTNDTDFNAIGKTGGEKTHLLTTQEIPSHSHYTVGVGTTIPTGDVDSNHPIATYATANATDLPYSFRNSTGNAVSGKTSNSGGGQEHNNMQPFEVFAIWVRTA